MTRVIAIFKLRTIYIFCCTFIFSIKFQFIYLDASKFTGKKLCVWYCCLFYCWIKENLTSNKIKPNKDLISNLIEHLKLR